MSNNAKLFEAVLKSFPNPTHITEIDLTGESDAIRFTWRGTRFRLSEAIGETVQGSMLHGDDMAALAHALMMRCYIAMRMAGPL